MLALEKKTEIIQNTDIFSKVSDEYCQAIAKRMGEKQFAAGTTIFSEGDPGDQLLIIYKGHIEIIKSQDTVLAVLEEGDVLGEMAPLSGERRSTSARAQDDVGVLFLKGQALRLLLHKIPDLSLRILRLVINRLRTANEQIHGDKEDAYSLEIASGPEKGTKLAIAKRLILGRSSGKSRVAGGRLSLAGATQASRRHAEIFYYIGNYFIKDLGSTNGTKLNGVKIKEIVSLAEGDSIEIGEIPLTFCKA